MIISFHAIISHEIISLYDNGIYSGQESLILPPTTFSAGSASLFFATKLYLNFAREVLKSLKNRAKIKEMARSAKIATGAEKKFGVKAYFFPVF